MKYIRFCPQCGKQLEYKNKNYMKHADEIKTVCVFCARQNNVKKQFELDPLYFKKKRARQDNSAFRTAEHKAKQAANVGIVRTDEYRASQSKAASGSNNRMYGRSYYDIWVEKYGKEQADIMNLEKKQKNSAASKGKNNPMYGKSSPIGSGNGWSGWYEGFYFRSLIELSFIIAHINDNIKTAECAAYKIEYVIDGTQRTYRPDYIIGNTLFEIKPKRLWRAANVQVKKEAAEKWCAAHNMIYVLIDPIRISDNDIIELYNLKKIKFIDRYELKFKSKFLKL